MNSEAKKIEHDADSGEVIEVIQSDDAQKSRINRAQDGAPVPSTAITAGDFINQLEEGQFSADLYYQMKEMNAILNDLAGEYPAKKHKGTINIKIDVSREDQMMIVQSKFSVKLPETPRPKSIFWTDEHNNFSRFAPNQQQMFGVRKPEGANRTVRKIS